ncbi:hypothetical protein [Nocardia camponoti]|uniref:hypothetical protein n=1 Tax=Nocardia camponoti TaxID=1616106 RepID=UPI00166B329B|nr:hypothetical protein [Nocardia camponoti]
MSKTQRTTARHRVGTAGLVHCRELPGVAAVFAARRRFWFATLLRPARHSLTTMRKRPSMATISWAPARAT